MWEYPGGKMEGDESIPDTVARELNEELGVEIEIVGPVAHCNFFLVENVDVHIWHARIIRGEPKPLVATELRWVDLTWAIDNLPCMPTVFVTYQAVQAYLKRRPR